jgi:hypothetical protein
MSDRLVKPGLLGPLDLPVLLAVAGLAAWAWLLSPNAEGARAAVYVDGRRVAWWLLSGPPALDTVQGALGPVVVEHGGGHVRIASAPCPHQLCVRMGGVSRVHDQVACVPSRLVVVVEGGEEDGLDAVP